jgi:hypothetical protein
VRDEYCRQTSVCNKIGFFLNTLIDVLKSNTFSDKILRTVPKQVCINIGKNV